METTAIPEDARHELVGQRLDGLLRRYIAILRQAQDVNARTEKPMKRFHGFMQEMKNIAEQANVLRADYHSSADWEPDLRAAVNGIYADGAEMLEEKLEALASELDALEKES